MQVRASSHAVRPALPSARGVERKGDDRMAMLAPPQPLVQVRIDERGKVHYRGRELAAGVVHPATSYMTIPIKKFARWKNAGKRTGSNKVTDPVSGQNYIHQGGEFYQLNGKVRAVQPVNVTHGVATHQALEARFINKELIDRRRANRTGGPLQEFDVGPFKKKVVIGGRAYSPLPKAKKAWRANNDHIPSGESLNQRNPGNPEAYAQGMTIAITADAHRKFSPTYGGRQKTHDIERDALGALRPSMRRVVHDRRHPARAFQRDTEFMLTKTGQDPSYAGQRKRRLRQLGAYRTLYRMNTRMHAAFGAGRGVDPQEHAMGITFPTVANPKQFEYAPALGSTQGQLIARQFMTRLVGEKFAKP
jgi:hypothetical protein